MEWKIEKNLYHTFPMDSNSLFVIMKDLHLIKVVTDAILKSYMKFRHHATDTPGTEESYHLCRHWKKK